MFDAYEAVNDLIDDINERYMLEDISDVRLKYANDIQRQKVRSMHGIKKRPVRSQFAPGPAGEREYRKFLTMYDHGTGTNMYDDITHERLNNDNPYNPDVSYSDVKSARHRLRGAGKRYNNADTKRYADNYMNYLANHR